MKQQILLIHGGDTFETYDEYLKFLKEFEIDYDSLGKKGWKENLQSDLGEDFEVIAPRMPNRTNAKYVEWKIWFENFLPFIKDDVILTGHSLGGIFLVKYLSEDTFPKKIKATFIVAAPFDDKDSEYHLADFILPSSLENFSKQAGEVTFICSKDDDVVPPIDFEKYKKALPAMNFIAFEDKGHFPQEHFPELVEFIKKLK